MKKILFCLVIAFIAFFVVSFNNKVYAQSQIVGLESINVDIKMNKDSTMDVSEEITYNLTGVIHEVYRDITLVDKQTLQYCQQYEYTQCGGFEFFTVTGVLDNNGNPLSENQYRVEPITTGSKDQIEVAWRFAPKGRDFSGENFKWTVKYKVYGSLGYFADYDLFYWNALPEERTSSIKKSVINISFPSDISFSIDNLEVLGGTYTFNYDYSDSTNTLVLDSQNVAPYEDFTVLLKIPKGVIDKYATLNLTLDPSVQDISYEGIKISGITNQLKGIPAGTHTMTFSKSGYISQDKQVTLKAGEEQSLEIKLEQSPIQKIKNALICIINAVACPLSFLFIGFLLYLWYSKGRDPVGRRTIVPWFKPPESIPSTIMGALKDEKVDIVDITSTIIDTAYQGYIKIKELKKDKFEFTKLKDFSDLVYVQKKIMDDIFDGKDIVTTDSLKNKFYIKLPPIRDAIYQDLVDRGYFTQRPDKVRGKYLGSGIFMIILGFVLVFVTPAFMIYTCGPGFIIIGIALIIFSFFMPKKTDKGAEILEKTKGFRMYLHTAERFRLQKLTPETFEKYLSYAMVFGIEKEWAKKFEDIYKQAPDWYESRTPLSTFDTLLLVNALSSMTNNVGRVMAASPQSSSSHGFGGFSGGGWSGGGGFGGGFGGGGGGGGGVGAR